MKKRATGQSSFSDLAVAGLGGPKTAALLARLDAAVPWEELVGPVLKLPEYAKYIADPSLPGERPIDPRVMLRGLMLQKWHNLSDPQLEEQLKDRISFRRFAGLSQQDPTPDETTFVKFRGRLREAKLDGVIFAAVLRHVESRGLLVKGGTIVDATIVEQSTGHKTAVITSTASHHDSRHIDALVEAVGEKRAVFADSAYSDAKRRERLEARGVLPAIIHKRVKGQKKLYPWQKKFNRLVSQVRAIGEHPYAWMKRLMNFARCRYRGLRRNAFDFTLTAAAYNVRKAVSLLAARVAKAPPAAAPA